MREKRLEDKCSPSFLFSPGTRRPRCSPIPALGGQRPTAEVGMAVGRKPSTPDAEEVGSGGARERARTQTSPRRVASPSPSRAPTARSAPDGDTRVRAPARSRMRAPPPTGPRAPGPTAHSATCRPGGPPPPQPSVGWTRQQAGWTRRPSSCLKGGCCGRRWGRRDGVAEKRTVG